MKKLLTLILALVLGIACVAFAGCNEESGIEGTYKIYSITNDVDGQVDTFVVGDEMGEGGPILTDDYMTITFNADGTCVSTTKDLFDNEVQTANATYTYEGNTITIDFEGDIMTATISGTTLTIVQTRSQGGMVVNTTLVFHKA